MTALSLHGVGYGCMGLSGHSLSDADAVIRTALDHGLTLIDTADIYGFGTPDGFGAAETVLGDVLAASPELRDQMVLATKGGIIPPRPYDSSHDYLMGALEASLTRLRVERIDLYQVHRPDLTVPFADLARTLDAMVTSGRVRAIGVSNFTASQTRALAAHLSAPLVTLQPEFSVLEQSPLTDGVLDYAQETDAAVLAWSPLGGGALFTEDGPVQSVIARIGRDTGWTATQIALAFTRSVGAKVLPLIGTTKRDRIVDAAKAADITLEARQVYDLIEAHRGTPMP